MSFNPSSIGNRPQSCYIFAQGCYQLSVSILLLLEIGLKVHEGNLNISTLLGFQSFFYWKSASKGKNSGFSLPNE